jgi:hypothetical protein
MAKCEEKLEGSRCMQLKSNQKVAGKTTCSLYERNCYIAEMNLMSRNKHSTRQAVVHKHDRNEVH